MTPRSVYFLALLITIQKRKSHLSSMLRYSHWYVQHFPIRVEIFQFSHVQFFLGENCSINDNQIQPEFY